MGSEQAISFRPWNTVQDEISGLLNRVAVDEFESLVKACANNKRRWFLSGQGRSGLVAQMAAMRFMHLGYDVHVVGEVTAPAVRSGDGLILVCGSGKTPISLGFAKLLSQREPNLLSSLTSHKARSRKWRT